MPERRGLLNWFRLPPPPDVAAVLAAVDLDDALRIARHLAAIGDTDLGFRPAGSPAAARAAAFLQGELRAAGIADVRTYEFPVDGWTFRGARVEAGGRRLTAASYGGAPGTPPGGLRLPLISVNRGTAADYAGRHTEGCAVLVELDFATMPWPSVVLAEAAHHGAAAVVAWAGAGYGQSAGALHTFDLSGCGRIPMVNVTAEAAAWLQQQAEVLVVADIARAPGTGRNVVGYLPGTDLAHELVVIGDHYDAWFHGFLDDAVGAAAVVALAGAAVRTGYRPRRTIALVLHDAEEYGKAGTPWDWCTGAYYQVNHLTPDWAGRTAAAVIFELCGVRDAPVFEWWCSPQLLPTAAAVLSGLNVGAVYPEGVRLHPGPTTLTDAWCYAAAGIPGVCNLELSPAYREGYYHTQNDTEALLDRDRYALHVAGLGALALTVDRSPPDPAALQAAHTSGRRLRLGGSMADTAVDPVAQAATDLKAVQAALAALERGVPAAAQAALAGVSGMGWGRHASYDVYRERLFAPAAWWAEGRLCPYLDAWHAYLNPSAAALRRLEAAARAHLATAQAAE